VSEGVIDSLCNEPRSASLYMWEGTRRGSFTSNKTIGEHPRIGALTHHQVQHQNKLRAARAQGRRTHTVEYIYHARRGSPADRENAQPHWILVPPPPPPSSPFG